MKKLEQFYNVNTYAEKLKPDDFDFDIDVFPDYIRKNNDDTIISLIREGDKKILLKGVTGLGKTRSAYEIIKEFGAKSYFVVLPSRGIKLPIWIPKNFFFFKRKIILYLDDLDKFIGEKTDITNIINEFKKNSKDLIVIATCREEEFEILEKDKINEKFKIVELDNFSIEDGEKLAKSVGEEFNPQEFDGTPGSIVLDSPRKKKYWEDFDESEKNLLRAIKLLNISNIFDPDINLLIKLHRTFPVNDNFNTYFHDLKKKKFISIKNNTVSCPDYYISKIVEDYPIANQHISDRLRLKDILTEIKRDDYLFYLGISFHSKEEYLHAINCYDESLKINPKIGDALFAKGNALYGLGKYEDAIKSYDNALEINPREQTWVNKGCAFDNLGKYEDAIKCCDNALKINPKLEEAWYNKGNYLADLGKYEDAIKSYDNALEINPKNEQVWYNKGITFYDLGKYEDAITCYDYALKINPKKEQVWFNKGIALHFLEKYEDAITCYDNALEINPK
ncbi:MAG: tetratricopeptide repeat protein, partial [Bacteroidales bacterium]|nr:tetratricopeptide repeat protein [Bacteroidales bacterium]